MAQNLCINHPQIRRCSSIQTSNIRVNMLEQIQEVSCDVFGVVWICVSVPSKDVFDLFSKERVRLKVEKISQKSEKHSLP